MKSPVEIVQRMLIETTPPSEIEFIVPTETVFIDLSNDI